MECFEPTGRLSALFILVRSPGAPLQDSEAGIDGLIKATRSDFAAHSSTGFDAVMPGNQNVRPCEFDVDVALAATMA